MKQVPGYPNYSLTIDGKVWSHKTNRWMVTTISNCGYVMVGMRRNDGKKHNKCLHSLMTITFIGDRPEGYQVCHADGDKLNNHINNLRYDTKANNEKDKVNHGTNPIGKRNPRAKLTEQDVLDIRWLYSMGVLQRELALIFNMGQSQIGNITSRKQWSHI